MVLRRRIGEIASMMLLSLLLMVASPDHWDIGLPFARPGHHDGAKGPGGESEQHARHCHGDAATCSEVPLTAISGMAALTAFLAFAGPALVLAGLPAAAIAPAGWMTGVATPPPRRARAI
jgi:hypothetical protein